MQTIDVTPTQQKTFVINLRGTSYAAQRFTKTAYIALGNLIRDKQGNFFDPTDQANQRKIGEIITDRITDDEYLKKLAYWLLVLFPNLPSDMVWYGNTNYSVPFGVCLEPEEIISIVAEAAKGLQKFYPEVSGATEAIEEEPATANGFKPTHRYLPPRKKRRK